MIYFVAIGACPWPRDKEKNLWDILEVSANWISEDVGSTPEERTKISGVRAEESSKTAFTSSTGGSVKRGPKLLPIKADIQKDNLSGLNERMKSIRWNSLQISCHSPENNKNTTNQLLKFKFIKLYIVDYFSYYDLCRIKDKNNVNIKVKK